MNMLRLMIVLLPLAGLAVALQGQEPAEKGDTPSCHQKSEAVTTAQQSGECDQAAKASSCSGEKAQTASQEKDCASECPFQAEATEVVTVSQEPGECSKSSCDEEKAATVSAEGGDCDQKSCDGDKAAATAVANAPKSGDCASECPSAAATAVTVSQEPGECSKSSCDEEKAATVSAEGGDCASQCPSKAAAVTASAQASQEGASCCETKMAKAAAAGEETPGCCESKLKAVAANLEAQQEGCSGEAAKISIDCMKEMAGTWYTVDEEGVPTGQIASEMEVTAGGNVIRETLFPGTEHEMVSVYYEKGGELYMTHYCITGNHPTFKASFDAGSQSVTWECQGGANFSDCSTVAHMHEGVTKVDENGVISGAWSLMANGQIDHTMEHRMMRVEDEIEVVEEIVEESDDAVAAIGR